MNAVITSIRLATTGVFAGSYLYGWRQQVAKLLADGYEDPTSFRSGTVTSDTDFDSPAFELNNRTVAVGTNVELSQRGYIQGQLCFEFNSTLSGSGTDNHITRWDGTTAIQDSLASIDDNGNVATPGNFSSNAGAGYLAQIAGSFSGASINLSIYDTGTLALLKNGGLALSGSQMSLGIPHDQNLVLTGTSITSTDTITAAYAVQRGTVALPILHSGVDGTLAPGMDITGGIITSAGSGSFVTTSAANVFTAKQTINAGATSPALDVQQTSSNASDTIRSRNAAGATTFEVTGAGDVSAHSFIGNLTGDVTGNLIGNLTGNTFGNASTATALQSAVTINGTSFDGTSNITITAAASTLTGSTLASGITASSLTSVGTLTGGATGAGFTIALTTSTVTGTLPAARLPSFGSGDVSFASGGGAGTIAASSVTLAKIAHAAANSKLLGSGSAGSGASYSEITVGTGLTMTGTTLSASGGSGTVTSVSVTSINGISGTVANPTTTPAISLTIGTGAGLRGHIDGLILSIPGGSGTPVLDVSAGSARDSTDAYTLSVSSTFAKTLGSTWAVGSGTLIGGLDTGTSAASTWYHVWLIAKADGSSTDVLFSLSATAPTMPATYTLKRRIGAGITDGSKNWTAFIQVGDEFLWGTGVQDVNTTVGTTATLYTLSVPPGIQVWAQIASFFGGNKVLLSSPDQADEAPSGTVWTDQGVAGPGMPSFIRTNTSGQIRGRASAAGLSIQLRTIGWRDPRGRDA